MYPTLAPGERVAFDRRAYRQAAPQLGDVVLAGPLPGVDGDVIKRVVGVPGDTILADDDRVWVNGVVLDEATGCPPEGAQEWLVPPEHYFLLGDAPDLSTDSRTFGPVPRAVIQGKARLVYWPLHSRRRV
jgi:signal peptidase I